MVPVYLVLPDETIDIGFLFARRCFLQSFARGESPLNCRFAYAGTLDLRAEQEIAMAQRAAADWMERADRVICYLDLKLTRDMAIELDWARRRELPIEFRRLVGGHPGIEILHQQGVPHNKEGCALCEGPRRWAEMQKKRRDKV